MEQDISSDQDELGIDGPIDDSTDSLAPVRFDVATAQPDYPGAGAFIASPYRSPRGAHKVTQVIIHITDGVSPEAKNTAHYFTQNARHVSAHYVVGRAGEIVQCVSHADIANHARGANTTTIGIEHCARVPSQTDQGMLPSDAQYLVSAKLVAWLCTQFQLPRDRNAIKGHCEVGTTNHHDCPVGDLPKYPVWDWGRFMQLVQEQ